VPRGERHRLSQKRKEKRGVAGISRSVQGIFARQEAIAISKAFCRAGKPPSNFCAARKCGGQPLAPEEKPACKPFG